MSAIPSLYSIEIKSSLSKLRKNIADPTLSKCSINVQSYLCYGNARRLISRDQREVMLWDVVVFYSFGFF